MYIKYIVFWIIQDIDKFNDFVWFNESNDLKLIIYDNLILPLMDYHYY